SPPMVRRGALVAQRSEARLLRLGRTASRRRTTEQLARRLQARRQRLDARSKERPVLPASLPAGAARAQLVERKGPCRDRRCHALLARSRRRRVSRRRGIGTDQRRTLARQPALPAARPAAAAQLGSRRSARDPSRLAEGARLVRG